MDQNVISQWVEAHREEFLEDIKALVRIQSDRGEPKPGAPFGEGPNHALTKALGRKKGRSYGAYRGALDFWQGKMGRMEPPKTKEN